jgi:trimeric autotransporter adhesin
MSSRWASANPREAIVADEHDDWMSGLGVNIAALRQAASDAASSAVQAVADTASGAVQAASDTASSQPSDGGTSGGFFSGIANAVGSAASSAVDTVESAASDAASAVGNAINTGVQTVIDANASMMQSVVDAVPLPDSVHDLATGAIDFSKGVSEGAYAGVKGLASGIVSGVEAVAKEGYALATDENAREQAAETVLHGAEAAGNFAATAVTDPSKAAGEVADAAGRAVDTVENVASSVYQGYEAAAAQGHGAEFIGKGVGQVGVLVAGAVLTDGASLAGEGAAIAGEGVALAGEGAAILGEGAAVVGEGAAVVGEGAAVLGEGTAMAGEGAAVVGEGAAATAGAETVTAGAEATSGADAAAALSEDGSVVDAAGDGADSAASNAEAETPVDPAEPKPRVQRSTVDPRETRPLGNIAPHDEQGLALRDGATGARESESEHILSRANIVEQTRNPATGVSPFDKAAYRDATTLKLGRETALEKTIGDNAAARALADSGGAPTPQMLQDSGLEAAIDRTLAAAQQTGDASVTTEGVNLAAHGELGKVFEVGTGDARSLLQGVNESEIDAALSDIENATVDPRFAAPKGMGIPLERGTAAADTAADSAMADAAAGDAADSTAADAADGATSDASDAEAAIAEEPPSQPRVRVSADPPPAEAPPSSPRPRVADGVLERAELEMAQAELEVEAVPEAEIEGGDAPTPRRLARRVPGPGVPPR